jgi:hypothetical protein
MRETDRKIPFLAKALLVSIAGLVFFYAIRDTGPRLKVLAILIFTYGATKILSKDLVHFPGWFYRLIVRIQDGKLQGKLYVFDEVRMHLFLIEGEAWISADGVKTLLHPSEQELLLLGKGYGVIPGTKVQGYSEAGLLQLIAKRLRSGGRRPVTRLDKWLRDDALPNLKRFPGSSL